MNAIVDWFNPQNTTLFLGIIAALGAVLIWGRTDRPLYMKWVFALVATACFLTYLFVMIVPPPA